MGYCERSSFQRRVEPAQVVERPLLCLCIAYTIEKAMFEWDRNNLRKIKAHRITREETEEALLNDPIPVYEQDV